MKCGACKTNSLPYNGRGHVFHYGRMTIVHTLECPTCGFVGKHAIKPFFRRLFYRAGIADT